MPRSKDVKRTTWNKTQGGPSFQTNAQSGVGKGLSNQHTVGGDPLEKRGTDRLRDENVADTPKGPQGRLCSQGQVTRELGRKWTFWA